MSYKIIVFVKQVPDTKNISGDAMKADGTVNRAALPAIFNPEDLNALELALQLKDRYGAKVVVATMGLPAAARILRESLCMGADEAYLLTDRALAGADTLATSYALSCCARKIGDFDLILCGRQAIDGDTAQVGPQIAEKLRLPQFSYVEEVISLEEKMIRAKRAIEGGYEILEAPMPVLLTVIDSNEPRPQHAARIMKFKKAKTYSEYKVDHPEVSKADFEAAASAKDLLIHEWSAADVDADVSRCGKSGSPTNVKQIMSVVLTAGDFKKVEPTEAGVSELIRELIEDHTLG
ncbi:MAG: electron transfer flavoprotein subunit beta/FixA family protein [Lentisphaeria bacterium]|nr:electron transfer flavoprotein subunit beta/FixA family protein [Lentisphaeria bacterium]